MKDFIVTKYFSHDMDDVIGKISLADDIIEVIKKAPDMFEFAIGFTCTPNENGVYEMVAQIHKSFVATYCASSDHLADKCTDF